MHPRIKEISPMASSPNMFWTSHLTTHPRSTAISTGMHFNSHTVSTVNEKAGHLIIIPTQYSQEFPKYFLHTQ